jgi:hypothetical protein
MKFRL